jgi:Tic22-like family
MYKSLTGLTAILGMSVPLAIAISQPARALPEAQIIEKLRAVPIFTITMTKTPNGSRDFVWESDGTSPKARLYTRGFIGLKDAQAFLKVFQKQQPAAGKSAQVSPIPLSAIYKMQLDAKQKSKNMGFLFVPTEPQLKNALTILKEPFKNNINYPVPLFVVTVKDKKQNIAIQRNDLTQMFFDKQEAQEWLKIAKEKNPKLAAKAEITVESLQNMLESLYKINHPRQQQIVFVPSRENAEIVRKIQAAQATQPSPAASTSPAPKK